jgi:hypothetical protein
VSIEDHWNIKKLLGKYINFTYPISHIVEVITNFRDKTLKKKQSGSFMIPNLPVEKYAERHQ